MVGLRGVLRILSGETGLTAAGIDIIMFVYYTPGLFFIVMTKYNYCIIMGSSCSSCSVEDQIGMV